MMCFCRSRKGPRASICSVEPLQSSDGEEISGSKELYCQVKKHLNNLKNCLFLSYAKNINENLYQAVESVDETLVGCCKLASTTRLRRPSTKVPYMLLCESHAFRLSLHNCCPGCGIFCSQVSLFSSGYSRYYVNFIFRVDLFNVNSMVKFTIIIETASYQSAMEAKKDFAPTAVP